MRIYTAPGMYNPLESDFDKAKLKILKHKKMASRSAWAQNISFAATEPRFHTLDRVVGPAPVAYRPKTDIADHIPGPRKTGPFGSSEKVIIIIIILLLLNMCTHAYRIHDFASAIS